MDLAKISPEELDKIISEGKGRSIVIRNNPPKNYRWISPDLSRHRSDNNVEHKCGCGHDMKEITIHFGYIKNSPGVFCPNCKNTQSIKY